MANKRTVYPIPKNTWVKIIDGETYAGISRDIDGVSYYSMSYNDSDSTPVGDIAANPTVEEMFLDSPKEILNDSAPAYIWIRCDNGQVGSVTVTI